MLPGFGYSPFDICFIFTVDVIWFLVFGLLGQSTIRDCSLGKFPGSEIFCGSTEVGTSDPVRTLKVNDL